MNCRDVAAKLVSIAVTTAAISIGSTGDGLAQTAAVEPRRFDLRVEMGALPAM